MNKKEIEKLRKAYWRELHKWELVNAVYRDVQNLYRDVRVLFKHQTKEEEKRAKAYYKALENLNKGE